MNFALLTTTSFSDTPSCDTCLQVLEGYDFIDLDSLLRQVCGILPNESASCCSDITLLTICGTISEVVGSYLAMPVIVDQETLETMSQDLFVSLVDGR